MQVYVSWRMTLDQFLTDKCGLGFLWSKARFDARRRVELKDSSPITQRQ